MLLLSQSNPVTVTNSFDSNSVDCARAHPPCPPPPPPPFWLHHIIHTAINTPIHIHSPLSTLHSNHITNDACSPIHPHPSIHVVALCLSPVS